MATPNLTYSFRAITRGSRWRLPPLGVDVALAVAVTAVTVWGCYSESNPSTQALRVMHGHVVTPAPAGAYLLVVGAGLALIWRRRRPRAVLAASLAGVLAFNALGYVGNAALVIPPIALYAVALKVPVRQSVALGTLTLLALGTIITASPFNSFGSGDIALCALVVVAVLGGIASANRRDYLAAVRTRSELFVRAQEEEIRRTVDAERLRIARELHDVVAHTMSTINVQAGVASYVTSDLPPAAADALRAIKTASKDGLRELRAILAVLRQADDPESNQPQPGLARLDALVAGVSAAGLPTEVVVTGRRCSLAPAVDLAAYRIVQESLTNAVRHAGPATATVHITYNHHDVRLRITDTGHGPSAAFPSAGHGLIGMRERAAAAGGSLSAGPATNGGFEVTALLPKAPGA
ncbi:sensor histidine kinase [Actinacidiphila acididurans]|uniref:histidine kinase n=1 Tax=Actinacidiphila acididurans TaxID=2784346 RepID=A0ABS2TWC2_9ACTN|nr:histidine kinase [Actinacidiphila acididurans]MBM9506585.1 two-component sensor histidine kinase [Actinacidiphila acididurans]